MASQTKTPSLASNLQSLLGGLRWRIRAYMWLEGIAMVALWLFATFWVALGFDYLFVWLGASELPWQARAVVLAGIVLVAGYILYRWIFRRVFVEMRDHSMAVVLERRFDNFNDSLLTSVEMNERPQHADQFNTEMLEHTREDARREAGNVTLGKVFNFIPLGVASTLATILGVIIVLFAVFFTDTFVLGASRLFFLSDEPWPRYAHIEVVGIEVAAGSDEEGQPTSDLIPFRDGVVKVAAGSEVVLRVRAETDREVVPETCTVFYRTEEGERGYAKMQVDGRDRDGYREYSFDGKPFRGITSTLTFDVRGYDHWVRKYRIDVVASPVLTGVTLDCEYPRYQYPDAISAKRKIPWTPGQTVPIGTNMIIRGESSKPLSKVFLENPNDNSVITLEPSPTSDEAAEGIEETSKFEFHLGVVKQDVTYLVTLQDVDDVVSESPYRIHIGATEDMPPVLEVRLKGIGTAVTPDVRIPLEGSIRDDYGIERTWYGMHRAWLEVQTPDAGVRQFPITLGTAGSATAAVDFKALREAETAPVAISPKQSLVLQAKAVDNFDLGDEPHEGIGDIFELEVVTEKELVRMLERREVGLRRRFEQIIAETSQLRDSLDVVSRVQDISRQPGDAERSDDDEEFLADQASRNRLRVQQAALQSQKSTQEVSGVSLSFAEIREELVNNRVDAQDKKERLINDVVDPLNEIAEEMFPELDARLETLRKALESSDKSDASLAALEQTEKILAEMESVLDKMIAIEDFNELLEIVRDILDEQKHLIDATKKEQQAELLKLLE